MKSCQKICSQTWILGLAIFLLLNSAGTNKSKHTERLQVNPTLDSDSNSSRRYLSNFEKIDFEFSNPQTVVANVPVVLPPKSANKGTAVLQYIPRNFLIAHKDSLGGTPKLKIKFSEDFDRTTVPEEKLFGIKTWTDKKSYNHEVQNSLIKPNPKNLLHFSDNGYNEAIPLLNFQKDSNFFIELQNFTENQEFIFEFSVCLKGCDSFWWQWIVYWYFMILFVLMGFVITFYIMVTVTNRYCPGIISPNNRFFGKCWLVRLIREAHEFLEKQKEKLSKTHKDNPSNHGQSGTIYLGFNGQKPEPGNSQITNLEDFDFDDIGHAYDDILKNPEPENTQVEMQKF